jgi:hypothetical protein
MCKVQREDFDSTLTAPWQQQNQPAGQRVTGIAWFGLRLKMTIQGFSSLLIALIKRWKMSTYTVFANLHRHVSERAFLLPGNRVPWNLEISIC